LPGSGEAVSGRVDLEAMLESRATHRAELGEEALRERVASRSISRRTRLVALTSVKPSLPSKNDDVVIQSLAEDLAAITFGQFAAQTAAVGPPSWLMESVLPDAGVVFLAAPPKTGKSRFVYSLIAAMSGPGELAGCKVTPGVAVLVSLEHDNRNDVLPMLEQAARGRGLRVDQLSGFVMSRLELDNEESYLPFMDFLDKVDAKLVVIDSFRRAHSRDEDKSSDAKLLGEALMVLTGFGKRLVLVVHHTTKSSGSLRGSGDYSALGAVITLSGSGKSVTLNAHRYTAPTFSMRLQFHHDDGKLVVEGSSAGTHADEIELKTKILDLLAKGPRNAAEIAPGLRKELGFKVDSSLVGPALKQMLSEGDLRFEKGKHGAKRWMMA
jgi:hypothetical protein